MKKRRKQRPLRIGVLSDTHCKSLGDLPEIVMKTFKGVDAFIHAGDSQYVSFLKELNKIAPVYSVKGNHDKDWKTFPLEEVLMLRIKQHTIAIVHGHSGEGKRTLERAKSGFNLREIDMIVYGHNHRGAGVRKTGSTLLLNPGSPTDTRQPQSSIAVLTVGKNLDVRMVYWDNHTKRKTQRKTQRRSA